MKGEGGVSMQYHGVLRVLNWDITTRRTVTVVCDHDPCKYTCCQKKRVGGWLEYLKNT